MDPTVDWVPLDGLLSAASQELEVGQLLHTSVFNLFEAMSAVEIGNPKMDAGRKVDRAPWQGGGVPAAVATALAATAAVAHTYPIPVAPVPLHIRQQLPKPRILLQHGGQQQQQSQQYSSCTNPSLASFKASATCEVPTVSAASWLQQQQLLALHEPVMLWCAYCRCPSQG